MNLNAQLQFGVSCEYISLLLRGTVNNDLLESVHRGSYRKGLFHRKEEIPLAFQANKTTESN
jgi:hypothetical protein